LTQTVFELNLKFDNVCYLAIPIDLARNFPTVKTAILKFKC